MGKGDEKAKEQKARLNQVPRTYVICAIGGDMRKCQIPTNEKTFKDVIRSRINIESVYQFEALYEMVIKSYVEVEQELLTFSLRELVGFSSDAHAAKFDISRRLMLLFTVIRLYRDSKLMAKMGVPRTIYKLFKERTTSDDTFLLMEEIRNYSQHSDQPVHWFVPDRKRTEDGLFYYSTKVLFDRDKIVKSIEAYGKKRKKSRPLDIGRLAALDPRIDLNAALRKYIESISQIHGLVREFFQDRFIQAKSLTEKTLIEFKDAHPGHYQGRCCVASFEGRRLIEYEDVYMSTIEAIEAFQERNQPLLNLTKRVIGIN